MRGIQKQGGASGAYKRRGEHATAPSKREKSLWWRAGRRKLVDARAPRGVAPPPKSNSVRAGILICFDILIRSAGSAHACTQRAISVMKIYEKRVVQTLCWDLG